MVCLYVGLFVYFCGSKVLRIQVVKTKSKKIMRKTLLMLVMMFTAMVASAQSVKTLGTVDNAVMQCDKKQGCESKCDKKLTCERKCEKNKNCEVKCVKVEQKQDCCKKAEQKQGCCKKADKQNCQSACKKAEQKQDCCKKAEQK